MRYTRYATAPACGRYTPTETTRQAYFSELVSNSGTIRRGADRFRWTRVDRQVDEELGAERVGGSGRLESRRDERGGQCDEVTSGLHRLFDAWRGRGGPARPTTRSRKTASGHATRV